MDRQPWFRIKGLLPSRRTPIEEFPWEWLKFVEPNIQRGSVAEGDHWFWTGYECRGIPMMTWNDPCGKRVRVTASHFVAGLFWTFHPLLTADAATSRHGKLWWVENACTYKNCLNPQHLVPRVRFNDGAGHEHG